MKLFSMFVPTLWSLFAVPGKEAVIQRHVVISPPSSTSALSDRQLLHDLFADGVDPHYKDRNIIRFTADINYLSVDTTETPNIFTIPLRTIFYSRNKRFPQYHGYSRSHFVRFMNSPYSNIMEYSDFCQLEDKLAHIFSSYVEDEKRYWLVWLDDPFFMDTDSLRSYGRPPRDITWVSASLQNGNPDFICMKNNADNHV